VRLRVLDTIHSGNLGIPVSSQLTSEPQGNLSKFHRALLSLARLVKARRVPYVAESI
jgi:hypothetical protein